MTVLTKPKNGDTIMYEDQPYYLAQHAGRFRIFLHDDKKYIDLDREGIVVDPKSDSRWVYVPPKDTKPVPVNRDKKWLIQVTLGGEVTDWPVSADSKAKALNKVYGLLSKKLAISIPAVNFMVHKPGNSITIKEL